MTKFVMSTVVTLSSHILMFSLLWHIINIHKSPGPDDLPNWLLKDMTPYLANHILAIFNTSIIQRRVPSIWKLANIIPVPKMYPPSSIQSDLRPISLTLTLCKILESFVGRWLLQRIGTKLDPLQFGALRGRSTTHALVSITHHWGCALDGKSVRALFTDFTEAFDKVDHTLLLNKLLPLLHPFPLSNGCSLSSKVVTNVLQSMTITQHELSGNAVRYLVRYSVFHL